MSPLFVNPHPANPRTFSLGLLLRDTHRTNFDFALRLPAKIMVRTHERSPSPTGSSDSLLKRLKTTHATDVDADSQFEEGVLDADNVRELHASYIANEPFK